MKGKKFQYFSHYLDSETPLYGGEIGVTVLPDKEIAKGDSANTKIVKLNNHSGTHIDFPNHFFDNGKKSHAYNADFWVFIRPYICNSSAGPGEIITLNEKLINEIPEDVDFLIIKTGFEQFRKHAIYWQNNPGLDPEMPKLLRSRFKNLKIVGVDFISITSFQNREIGRIAHRNFLDNDSPILIVEDMMLNNCDFQPKSLVCLPILIYGVDGAPVTIIAEK